MDGYKPHFVNNQLSFGAIHEGDKASAQSHGRFAKNRDDFSGKGITSLIYITLIREEKVFIFQTETVFLRLFYCYECHFSSHSTQHRDVGYHASLLLGLLLGADLGLERDCL